MDLLSPHFSFLELTITSHRALLEQNRHEALLVRPQLQELCTTLLEPVRAHFGKPVIVHSGFRCKALNTAIKGSKTSQHMLGQAADFHVAGLELEPVWTWIAQSGLPFGQCILEGAGKTPAWIHLSLGQPYRSVAKCGEVLRIDTATGKVIRVQKIQT